VYIEPGPLHDDIQSLCEEFRDLFQDDLSQQPAFVDEMKIELKEGQFPRPVPPRRVSPESRQIIQQEIQTLLDQGIVRPSTSPYCSPIVLVRKEGKKPRMCVDYTQVNACTVDLKYPMQNTKELLDRMAGKRWFATLDLRSGFHQMPLDQTSIPLTAFASQDGLYEYTRVPFGLKNAPPYFQRVMNGVLSGLVGNGCEVFIDDIGIAGTDPADFLRILRAVFERLRQFRLRLKSAKCRLGLSEMVFLGHKVDGTGISLTEERKQGLLDMSTPKTPAQLRSFLGLANYMRSFVPRFSEVVKPLYQLCSENAQFAWTGSHERIFQDIKAAIKNAPVLHHLDYSLPIVLRTDASTLGVGGTLLQKIDGRELSVCFLSRAFNDTESRWSTIEQEAFAIFFCITSLSHYLLGHHFIVETDHRNLMYLSKSTVPKLIRWRLRLQEFTFSVVHISGKSNVVADALSRCFVLNVVHLPDIKEAHNCIVGHKGIQATMDLLKSAGKSWATMSKDIEEYIKSCPTCQKVRLGQASAAASLSTTVVEEPFSTVAVDAMGPFPPDEEGYTTILVVIDCFTRFVELHRAKSTKAVEAVDALLQVFGRYGAPKYLRSDQGPQFVADVIKEFLSRVGASPRYTIAYRHESNGIVERANEEVGRHLRAIVFDKRVTTQWSKALPFVQRILNATPHSSIGTTPARLLFGDAVHLDREIFLPTSQSQRTAVVEDYIQELTALQKDVVTASQEHQSSVVEARLAKNPSDTRRFEIGQYVLISYPNRPPSKLAPKWRGPVIIVAIQGHMCSCQDLLTLRLSDYHVSRLKHYNMDQTNDPVDVAQVDNDEYRVQEIVDHVGKKKKDLQFRVRWCGYGPEDDSWLPYSEVRDLQAMDVYLKSHPGLRL
jgi:hypothetical protein